MTITHSFVIRFDAIFCFRSVQIGDRLVMRVTRMMRVMRMMRVTKLTRVMRVRRVTRVMRVMRCPHWRQDLVP